MFYMVWEITPYSNHNDNCSEIKITAKEPLGASSLFILKNSPDLVIYLHYHPLQYCLHPDRENFRKILPIGVITLYQYLPQYIPLDHVFKFSRSGEISRSKELPLIRELCLADGITIRTLFQRKFKSEEFNSLCDCKHDLSWKVWQSSSDPRHYLMLVLHILNNRMK